MVRKLKHHEQRLLRKVDFVNYPRDATHRSSAVLRRYSVTNPADYTSYNRLAGSIRQLAHKLSLLPPESTFRRKHEDLLLEKLFDMGLLGTGGGGKGKLSDVEKKITVSAFCRRRLGVVMMRLQMAEMVSAANKFVEHGHVRVGTETVTDPAFLVPRYGVFTQIRLLEAWLTLLQKSGRLCDLGGLVEDQAEHSEISRQAG